MIPAVMPTYARADVRFVEGQGSWLVDDRGRRYLDFGSGIAVACLGHCHPHLVDTVKRQAAALWHTSNLFQIPEQERLGRRLVNATFADTVFFCNSGAEAWECGVKTVRRYHYANGNPQRWRIITVEGCFHGRTMAGISAAKSEKLTKGFGPLLDGFDQVAFGNLNELRMAITEETAAIHVEPIQGEGGIRALDPEFLQEIRRICDEFGILMFLDEIQSGNGRTGKYFAYEWAGITPDVMCTAKGLGGGFPIGACLATEDAAKGMVAGTHGTTYGGNPLACAVGNAVLDVLLEDGFLADVERKGTMMSEGLQALVDAHPAVFSEARGLGLMAGLRCVGPVGDVVPELRDRHGLVVIPAAENVIRILPALTLTDEEIKDGLDRLNTFAVSKTQSEGGGTDG